MELYVNTQDYTIKTGKKYMSGDIVRIIVNNNIEKICKVEFKNGIFGVMFSKNKELTAFPHFCKNNFFGSDRNIFACVGQF